MKPMTAEKLLEKSISARKGLARKRAALPMGEKLKMLVKLQQLSLAVRPSQGLNDRRRVWKLK